MNKLKQHLAGTESGPVPATDDLERLVAECWADLACSDEGGMEACKVVGRMEQVVWTPPVLSFVIERHGGLTCGSTRAEVQHWAINLDKNEATITKEGYRQVKPMAPRESVKAAAEEITRLILERKEDNRLQWLSDGGVRVLLHKIYPKNSGFHRTVSERRNRFRKYVEESLTENLWRKEGRNRYEPLFPDEDFGDQSGDSVTQRNHAGNESTPIEVPAETKDKLNRLRILGALAHRERADDSELAEWGRLTHELAGQFLPVVQLLATSGLLTICAEDEKHAQDEHLSPKHRLVGWEANHVFINGDIWVKGGEVTTTMPKHPTCPQPAVHKEE